MSLMMVVKHTLAGSTSFGFRHVCLREFSITRVQVPVEIKGKVGRTETEVRGGYKLSAVGLGTQPGSSEGRAHDFNFEPSLQPLTQLLKSQALPHLVVRREHLCCNMFWSDLHQVSFFEALSFIRAGSRCHGPWGNFPDT